MRKILIIEDDLAIAKSIKNELELWNYQAEFIHDLSNVLKEFNEYKPDLVLLDVSLPFHNGYHWCQEIRKISQVPIIFISSKSEKMDIVLAMQFGGDDYIIKPIDLGLTIAKIGALIRRTYDYVQDVDQLFFQDLILNISKAQLISQDAVINLTKTELSIMISLFREKGAYVSRNSIMERCWNGDDFIDDNTLAVNITRLRKKLAQIGYPKAIATKKGIGYAFVGRNDEKD